MLLCSAPSCRRYPGYLWGFAGPYTNHHLTPRELLAVSSGYRVSVIGRERRRWTLSIRVKPTEGQTSSFIRLACENLRRSRERPSEASLRGGTGEEQPDIQRSDTGGPGGGMSKLVPPIPILERRHRCAHEYS